MKIREINGKFSFLKKSPPKLVMFIRILIFVGYLCNAFICDVFKAWFKLRKVCEDTTTDKVLWYNSKIEVKKKTIFYRTWSEKGVNFISDLLYEKKRFINLNDFKQKYNISCMYLKYFGLVSAVTTW